MVKQNLGSSLGRTESVVGAPSRRHEYGVHCAARPVRAEGAPQGPAAPRGTSS
jgi:hypothetical protein